MDLQLTRRTALVTGGTKGIGRAVVEALAAEGADVAFCARSADDVAKAETEIGGTVAGTAVDVRDGALALHPTGRMGTPEETAYAVVMLASPRASRISGTNLVVNGALTRGVQL